MPLPRLQAPFLCGPWNRSLPGVGSGDPSPVATQYRLTSHNDAQTVTKRASRTHLTGKHTFHLIFLSLQLSKKSLQIYGTPPAHEGVVQLCDTAPALSAGLREFWIYGRTCLLKGDISTDKTKN